MALKEILRIPRLRLLGKKEVIKLYEAFMVCDGTYESIMALVRGVKFVH